MDERAFPAPEQPLKEFPPEVVARWYAWRALRQRVLRGLADTSEWDAEGDALAVLDPELATLVAAERHQHAGQLAARRR